MKKVKGLMMTAVLDLFKYKKEEYSLLYVVLFSCVTFEVVGVTRSFALTDIIYLLFAILFFYKNLTKKHKGNVLGSQYLYLVAFLLLSLYSYSSFGAGRMFLSQLRFIFNCAIYIVIFSYFKGSMYDEKDKLLSSYIYVCVIASTFIIVQNISFYIFHHTIKYDIGDFNAASRYIYSASEMYRTGGFLNEPSWFALFTGPVLEIAYQRKKYKELILCVLGIAISTSSMGFLFLAIFAISKIRGRNIRAIFITLFVVTALYFVFPQAFGRIFESLKFEEGANTNDARVISPFVFAIDRGIPLFGTDVSDVIGVSVFLNTFLYVLLCFGIVGLFVFLIMILQKQSICLSLILLSGVIIEGCYGRVDFWMALLAASVFCLSISDKGKTVKYRIAQ